MRHILPAHTATWTLWDPSLAFSCTTFCLYTSCGLLEKSSKNICEPRASPVAYAFPFLLCVSAAVPVDKREDADGAGHVVRRGQKPAQQVAQAPSLHG